MAKIQISRIYNAPRGAVWDSWDDYANIGIWNPNITASRLIKQGPSTGLGALRQCDLNEDGSQYLRERIVDYVPGSRMVVDIYESTLPMAYARLGINLSEHTPYQTQVDLEFVFKPKMGPIGALMIPLMKPQLRKQLNGLLEENERHVLETAAKQGAKKMTATMVVTVLPKADGAEHMQAYTAGVGPLFGAAGGELVKRVRVAKPVLGELKFAMAMMMDFPSAEAIEKVFASDEYKKFVPTRDKAFEFFDVVIGEEF